MIKAILPCCGYGSRMNMQLDQSKEMLPDSNGNPLIKYHLDICFKYGLEPLIITRAEKTDLIKYVETFCDVLIIEPKREWPYTILKSWEKWEEDNVLLLPDTRFEPHDIINNIKRDLELGADISIALHSVMDANKWCIVNDYQLHEKSNGFHGQQYAFGVIGFKKRAGIHLFSELNINKEANLYNASFQYLDSFVDVTRNGTVEV